MTGQKLESNLREELEVSVFIKGVRPGEDLYMWSSRGRDSVADVRRIYGTIRFNRDPKFKLWSTEGSGSR